MSGGDFVRDSSSDDKFYFTLYVLTKKKAVNPVQDFFSNSFSILKQKMTKGCCYKEV